MIIAWYLRSGNKMDSLENQRAYLKQYLSRKTDLLKKQEGGILEYIDSAGALSDTCSDTGENSFWFHAAEKNAGFDTMLEDAKKGRFQVLVIKNLSSFGMDEERISSYVQEIFPLLHVRLLVAETGLDSEAVRKNRPVCRKAIPEERRPVYQEQDLAKPENYRTCLYRHIRSQKRKEEHERKWKSGLPASGAPPFGYRASKVQKGSWEIDPEAAEIVRQIFEKASEGLGTTEIAGFLNEKKLPTPWVYEAQHGKRSLSPSDTIPAERLWDGDKVRMILLRYEYTGALVRGKTKVLLSGTGRRCVQPKERQTIIRQVHPALVSEARYAAAISIIHSQKTRTSRLEQEYPLKSKVFCGTCHRRLQYGVTARKAFFFCRHGRQTGVYSSCCKEEYLTADLELRILQELKPYLSREEVLHLEKNRKALEQYLEAVYVYDPEHIEIRLK